MAAFLGACGDETHETPRGGGATGQGGAGTGGAPTGGGDDTGGTNAGGANTGGMGGSTAGCVVYVDGTDGSDAASGLSWSNARATVNAGIAAAAAQPCSQPEVWVRAGTYHPTEADDRSASITLVAGLGLYGGFVGDETAREERDRSRTPRHCRATSAFSTTRATTAITS